MFTLQTRPLCNAARYHRGVKSAALTVLSGPLLMAALCGLGMPLGYYLGPIAAGIILGVVAIGLGVLLARFTSGLTAGLAVVLGVLPGIASSLGYHNLRELDAGTFVRDVPLAELPRYSGKDRLTLRDGEAHQELSELAVEKVVLQKGPSDRLTVTVSCEAWPIAPEGWSRSEPVPVWRFGDTPHRQFAALSEAVFHPGPPSELCQKAIDRAQAKHHLTTAPGAIFLEDYVSDSRDEASNRRQGPFAVALLGFLWVVVALYQVVRQAIATLRSQRGTRAP